MFVVYPYLLGLWLVQPYLSAAVPLAGDAEPNGRIVGGNRVSILLHPHQISLRRRVGETYAYSHSCGGSILDSRTVLTAAHCVNNRNASNFLVVAGTNHRSGADGAVVRIEKIVQHELYNSSITNNDVALLFLQPELPLNGETIAPIELASVQPAEGDSAVVTGWGKTSEDGIASDWLQQVELPIISNDRCQESYYWRPITAGMLCAQHNLGGRDACQGDSGGPLLAKRKLVGIVSWGEGCARIGFAGVYSNVAYFKDWIEKVRAENAPPTV